MPQAGFDPPFAERRRIYWMKNGRLSELSHHGWIMWLTLVYLKFTQGDKSNIYFKIIEVF